MNNKKKASYISAALKTRKGKKKLAEDILGGLQFRKDAYDDFIMWYGREFMLLESMLYTAAESYNETFFIGMLDRCLELWYAYGRRDEIFQEKVFPRAVRNMQYAMLDKKQEEAMEQIRNEEDRRMFADLKKAADIAKKTGKTVPISKIKKIYKKSHKRGHHG